MVTLLLLRGWFGKGRPCGSGGGVGVLRRRVGVGLFGQPGVLQAVRGTGTLRRVIGQHGEQEVSEGAGILGLPLILLCQDVIQAPGLQVADVPQLSPLCKELS